MSAHLCLMAWNEPMGRPNCTRTFAYSTAISSTFCAPPTCSAASATAARSSTRSSTDQPAPSVPMRVAGVPENSSFACLRVWSVVASGDEDEIRRVPVEHEHLRAVERVPVTRLRRLDRDAALVPTTALLGERERGDRLARRDPGQQLLLGGVVARVQQRVGGEHDRREVRRGQQGAAHLLEHDGELDVAEALAAELLGDDERLQAELVRHLRPRGGVVALGRLHEAADLRLARLVVEELADDAAELFLLLGEGEVHGRIVACRSRRRQLRWCTHVYVNVRELRANLAA